ncbi:hypothetical protein Y032_1084g3576 [Ancylostoma ceylanicum]|uniref:SEA domain-containing protein n=1 Tax=Ancylostoma ceylanicum TaxID=53326 RepID=A0A016W6R6_9BILA|nr:hypothetical protein Y032_1084g3576 [Ancylostoma ceylanicum]
MLRLLYLLFVARTVLSCAPGTGNDIATMTLRTNSHHSYSNPYYYTSRVEQEMRKLFRAHNINYDPNFVRITTRGENDKLVVTVQAYSVDCGRAPDFMSKLRRQIGDLIQSGHVSCSNGMEFNV